MFGVLRLHQHVAVKQNFPTVYSTIYHLKYDYLLIISEDLLFIILSPIPVYNMLHVHIVATRIVRESDYSPAIALSEDNKALPKICMLVHFKMSHFV